MDFTLGINMSEVGVMVTGLLLLPIVGMVGAWMAYIIMKR